MPNRRDFFKCLGHTSAGLYMLAHGLEASAQGGRKRIIVNGQEIQTVDIHAHVVIPEVEEVIGNTPLGGRNYPDWYVFSQDRIARMDERGIDIAAISINTYWWYEADRRLADRIVQLHDEAIADWVSQHPDRFVGLTSVALQHPELAADQLERAVTEYGARGASVGGTVLQESNALEKYDPFWAKAQELDVPVFMHPTNSEQILREGGLPAIGNQGNIIGNPLETTVFLTNMIYEGVFDRFPGLKVCGAHGGGYLPSYFGRTEVGCARPNANCKNMRRPSDYLRSNIYADSMVFSFEALRHLVAEMGVSQVVYGSDQPFPWPDTMDLIVEADFLTDSQKIAILGGNLSRLLRIES
jgi:aminocarboxymuconate-semialdehyde decarboxylase